MPSVFIPFIASSRGWEHVEHPEVVLFYLHGNNSPKP